MCKIMNYPDIVFIIFLISGNSEEFTKIPPQREGFRNLMKIKMGVGTIRKD